MIITYARSKYNTITRSDSIIFQFLYFQSFLHLYFRLCKSQQHLSDSYERFNETKSYHSRSACGLHSIPSESFPDPLHYTRGNRTDPDRLNILDWPESPRRYRSIQSLDTVSGLVDIVEDGWPIEGNRSIDCIYTQVNFPFILNICQIFYIIHLNNLNFIAKNEVIL